MAFFKKKDNPYDEASRGLNSASKAADRIVFDQLNDDDEHARDLALQLKNGCPLVLNFELVDKEVVNKFLGFFTGVAWALDGKCVAINKYTYLFAKRADFLDGSLMNFIKDIPTK